MRGLITGSRRLIRSGIVEIHDEDAASVLVGAAAGRGRDLRRVPLTTRTRRPPASPWATDADPPPRRRRRRGRRTSAGDASRPHPDQSSRLDESQRPLPATGTAAATSCRWTARPGGSATTSASGTTANECDDDDDWDDDGRRCGRRAARSPDRRLPGTFSWEDVSAPTTTAILGPSPRTSHRELPPSCHA